MMTKRLPQLSSSQPTQQQRPYKYQDLRRKFKAGADSSAARGEEEYRQLLGSRESTKLGGRSTTNLARSGTNLGGGGGGGLTSRSNNGGNRGSNSNLLTARSNTNLGVSKENLARSNTNLAASRESLVIPEEAEPKPTGKPPLKPEVKQSSNKTAATATQSGDKEHGKLRDNIKSRQTSVDQLNKRTEQGQPVYSFTLSKADRSKSEPVLFPPLSDRQKAIKAAADAVGQKGNEPENSQSKDQDKPSKDDKKESNPINTVKFPIVSRYDLYKHLGIQQPRRKRTRKESEVSEIRNYARQRQNSMHKGTPRIVPGGAAENSGRSRNNNSVVHGGGGANQEDMVPNKKLEQYKKWHEQQASKRRSRDYDTKEASRLANIYNKGDETAKQRSHPERLPTRHRRNDTTLPKIGIKDRGGVSNHGNTPRGGLGDNTNNPQDGSHTDRSKRPPSQQPSNGAHSNQGGARGESPPAPIPKELLDRKYSARTWRTWRHHHDSYAYDNVDEYIEENELMDDEKIWWIKQWIVAVAKASADDDMSDTDDDDDVTTTVTSSNENKSNATETASKG